MNKNVKVLEEVMGFKADELWAGGDRARSRLGNQINADQPRQRWSQCRYYEPASLEAAMLSGVAAGLFPDLDSACARMVRINDRY